MKDNLSEEVVPVINKPKKLATGLPVVKDGYFCEFDSKTKIAKLYSSEGELIIDNILLPFINDSSEFLNFFICLSSLFGMFGNGQQGKKNPEKYEWFFKKQNENDIFIIKEGDIFTFDKNHQGQNTYSFYLNRKSYVILWKHNACTLFKFLKNDQDIKDYVAAVGKFYMYKIREAINNGNKLTWSFIAD